jgi:hypothetical protein
MLDRSGASGMKSTTVAAPSLASKRVSRMRVLPDSFVSPGPFRRAGRFSNARAPSCQGALQSRPPNRSAASRANRSNHRGRRERRPSGPRSAHNPQCGLAWLLTISRVQS